jgi:hypothetical protein
VSLSDLERSPGDGPEPFLQPDKLEAVGFGRKPNLSCRGPSLGNQKHFDDSRNPHDLGRVLSLLRLALPLPARIPRTILAVFLLQEFSQTLFRLPSAFGSCLARSFEFSSRNAPLPPKC